MKIEITTKKSFYRIISASWKLHWWRYYKRCEAKSAKWLIWSARCGWFWIDCYVLTNSEVARNRLDKSLLDFAVRANDDYMRELSEVVDEALVKTICPKTNQ